MTVIDFHNVSPRTEIHLAKNEEVLSIDNAYTVRHGDLCDVYSYGDSKGAPPRMVLRVTEVLRYTNFGQPPKDTSDTNQIPPSSLSNSSGSISPVKTSGAPAVPPIGEIVSTYAMESLKPVPRPSVAELQDQYIANLAVVHGNVQQNIDQTKQTHAERQTSFNHVERKTPPGISSALDFLVESTSDYSQDSAWSAMKQIAFRKNDDTGQFELPNLPSGIGRHRWTGGAHRKAAWLKRAVRWSKREFTRRTAYGLLAFRVYATPVTMEISR